MYTIRCYRLLSSHGLPIQFYPSISIQNQSIHEFIRRALMTTQRIIHREACSQLFSYTRSQLRSVASALCLSQFFLQHFPIEFSMLIFHQLSCRVSTPNHCACENRGSLVEPLCIGVRTPVAVQQFDSLSHANTIVRTHIHSIQSTSHKHKKKMTRTKAEHTNPPPQQKKFHTREKTSNKMLPLLVVGFQLTKAIWAQRVFF